VPPEREPQRERELMQTIFDLMANERVKLTVEGEIGNVDAQLEVWEGGAGLGYWRIQGQAIGEETADDAIAAVFRNRTEMGYGG
jgi:hypothetical protein